MHAGYRSAGYHKLYWVYVDFDAFVFSAAAALRACSASSLTPFSTSFSSES